MCSLPSNSNSGIILTDILAHEPNHECKNNIEEWKQSKCSLGMEQKNQSATQWGPVQS